MIDLSLEKDPTYLDCSSDFVESEGLGKNDARFHNLDLFSDQLGFQVGENWMLKECGDVNGDGGAEGVDLVARDEADGVSGDETQGAESIHGAHSLVKELLVRQSFARVPVDPHRVVRSESCILLQHV